VEDIGNDREVKTESEREIRVIGASSTIKTGRNDMAEILASSTTKTGRNDIAESGAKTPKIKSISTNLNWSGYSSSGMLPRSGRYWK
jgi:hypothetical protein